MGMMRPGERYQEEWWLREEYIMKNRSAREIADEFGVNTQSETVESLSAAS